MLGVFYVVHIVHVMHLFTPNICIGNTKSTFPHIQTLLITFEIEHKSFTGFAIERLDEPQASEEQLIEALRDKDGYILGGIEKVTTKVIDSADDLKAIAFTGSDWAQFIPGHQHATEKGITIANAPGANAFAVAEYTLAAILGMTRNMFELTRVGERTFHTTGSLRGKTIGIIGMGNIGTKLTEFLQPFEVNIVYHSRTRKKEIEEKFGARYLGLGELLATSDVVSIHIPKSSGAILGKDKLAKMKDGSLLINCAYSGAADPDALYTELSSGRLRAFKDGPIDVRYNSLGLSVWNNSNASTAFNTHEANTTTSDVVVKDLIRMLG